MHHTTTTTATATTLITLHYNYNLQLQLNYNPTTLQLHLQLQLHHTTLHPAVVVTWPLQPLQPLQKTQLQPPFGPSVGSLCHPWVTTTNPSYRFPILETSATALCGTTGNTDQKGSKWELAKNELKWDAFQLLQNLLATPFCLRTFWADVFPVRAARGMLIMMLLPGRAVLRFPTDFPPAPLEKRRRSCGQLVSIIGLNWSELGCWFWQCDNGMTMGMHRQSLVAASAKALSHCYLSLLWNETCASLCVWTFLRLHRALALFEGEGQHLKHHEPCFGLWFYLPTSFERAHLFARCQPKDPRIRAARLPFTGQNDALLLEFRVFTIHENCPPLKAIRK